MLKLVRRIEDPFKRAIIIDMAKAPLFVKSQNILTTCRVLLGTR